MKKMAQKRILKSLLDISGFTNFVENPDLILGLIIEECVLLTRAEWGVILSYDSNLNLEAFQITKVIKDREKSRIASILNSKVRNIIDKHKREEILKEELWNRKDIERVFKKALDRKIKGVLLCPIKKKDRLLGLAIVVNKRKGSSFTNKDRENFAVISQEASIVIENINLFKAKLQNERMAAIGQTIAGISHYVKNILQGISTGSYLLNAGIKDEDVATIKDAWKVVNKNTERISELVMDMLYYSRERRLERQKIDPRALVEDVLGLVRGRLKEKGITLLLSIKELPRYMAVNEKGLHRSILNIIVNAIDACNKSDSRIKLETRLDRPSRTLKIIISDNGKGISKEDQKRIFQPFYTQNKGKATGLGLAITKKVIEEHDGSIKVESELNKGTAFEISVPVRKKAP